jgi:membrane dipeptidase
MSAGANKEQIVGRRHFLKSTAGLIVAAPFINLGSFQAFAGSSQTYSVRAIDLVNESLVVDMLSLLDLTKVFATPKGEDAFKFSRDELLTIKASGIDVFHPAIGISGRPAYANALQFMASLNGLVAEHPDLVMRVDSAQDFNDLSKNGKLGVVLGVQNSDHFRTVDDVKEFYHLGQRISQLTYNSQNHIGSGSTDRVDGGISDFGHQIVKSMNDVGMAIDVSHCGDQTTLDAFELSKLPVLITHSNCRALVEGHPRSKTDQAIKRMAEIGGVMGITAVRNFVKNEEPTTIEHYVDHIDHVVKLVGIEHVGIGTDSDIDGYDDLPAETYNQLKAGYKSKYAFREKIDIEEMDHPKKMFDLAETLIRREYSNDNIQAILGGNFKRALTKLWGS